MRFLVIEFGDAELCSFLAYGDVLVGNKFGSADTCTVFWLTFFYINWINFFLNVKLFDFPFR
jgi:hypothetical protein